MSRRLGVLFSCPERRTGSQWSMFQAFMPALHRLRPDMVHLSFTSVESSLPGVETVRVPEPLAGGNPLRMLRGLRLHDRGTAEAVRRTGVEDLLVPFTYEMVARSPVPQTAFVLDLLPLRFPRWFPQSALLWRFRLAPALRRVPKICVISEQTKRDLIELVGIPEERIRVTYVGFTPAIPGGERRPVPGRLLYVSSSHAPHKNVEGMVRAFALVARERPEATLRVIGKHDPRYTPGLRALAASLGVEKAVSLEENVDEAGLDGAYREADLFVYPSLYEGFGMPPLEAMAAGVPVVASNVGAIAEISGAGALTFDPASPEAIADAIRQGLDDEALREGLVLRGAARCRDFSWDATAQSTIEWIDA